MIFIDRDADTDYLIERLGEFGCNDALVAIGQPGRITLEFTLQSQDEFAARASVLADVKKAIPTAKLIEVDRGCEV